MHHELILLCMSVSVVITTLPPLHLESGSTTCVTDNFCKGPYTDGYVCKSGSLPDVQTTVCEALNVLYNHWSAQAVLFDHLVKELIKILKSAQAGQESSEVVQGAISEIHLRLQVGQNATSQLLAELDTLRGRQATSAALQVVKFFLFIGYLLTLATFYLVKQCWMHRERLAEEEVELIEQKLQERKAIRRMAAAKA